MQWPLVGQKNVRIDTKLVDLRSTAGILSGSGHGTEGYKRCGSFYILSLRWISALLAFD